FQLLMTKKILSNIEWRVSKEPVHFEDALSFMQNRVEEIIAGTKPQLIWLLEHHPVYTAGISAKDSDLLVKTDIPIFQTNRGGKYTYHAPGMKIIYVMLDLKKFFAPQKPDVARFVEFLENWIISILADFGIKGEIKKGRVGIWVVDKNAKEEKSEKKIAAIGIKLKKWVSYHGIAINVSPDLSGFDNIIPCGIKEFGITSIAEVLGQVIDQKNFDKIVQEKFGLIYGKAQFY
ncbi:MAG: lipoyl(octanoyl) transferase LipB, partial [Rickettsiales bacterium]|nr:lipoyl(octanoyl) transferase LipB [Rickettsiales bacterium]